MARCGWRPLQSYPNHLVLLAEQPIRPTTMGTDVFASRLNVCLYRFTSNDQPNPCLPSCHVISTLRLVHELGFEAG